jgi:putative transposase
MIKLICLILKLGELTMSEDILKQLTESENFDFDSLKKEVTAGLKAGRPFLGKDGTLTPLIKRLIEASLYGEIEAHVAETKPQTNRRNGKTSKIIKSDSGTFELETPRDRNGTFSTSAKNFQKNQ